MKFVVVLLAALFALAAASNDKQLGLNFPCSFHVNVTYDGSFGWHEMWGTMNGTQLAYLRDDIFSTENVTRRMRFDLSRGNFWDNVPYSYNYTLGKCVDGYANYEAELAIFNKMFNYERGPEAVVCPSQCPELGANTCVQYNTQWDHHIIIVDSSTNRVVMWKNNYYGLPAKYYHWFDDGIRASWDFPFSFCNGAEVSSPSICPASIAMVGKAVLLLGLLFALLF